MAGQGGCRDEEGCWGFEVYFIPIATREAPVNVRGGGH